MFAHTDRSSFSMRSGQSVMSSISVIPEVHPPAPVATEVMVMARVRPVQGEMKRCLRVDTEANSVVLRPAAERQSERVFTFDYVADESCTQEQVFIRAGKDLITSCMQGVHATVFAYGQTGSGKTYTMQVCGATHPTAHSNITTGVGRRRRSQPWTHSPCFGEFV